MTISECRPPAGGDTGFEFPLGDELRGERATLGKTLLDVQRDLRIKASYIAGIEDCDLSAFPNPSFVAGYIRSYARYLSLDPDTVFQRFCAESGFTPKTAAASGGRRAAASGVETFRPNFALATPKRGVLPALPISAIGSVLVLVALVAGLGYGAWVVLQNIQRVEFAPVDDLPLAVAEIETLETPAVSEIEEPALTDLAKPVAATALADLYRQQELVVPILMPRDGPIAAIDPDQVGPLAMRLPADADGSGATDRSAEASTGPHPPIFDGDQADAVSAAVSAAVLAASAPQPLVVVAERAAWVRVYLENGTVIFERILETGETYTPPEGVGAPMIWAGNAGSVYVRVGESLHGPLGIGTRAVRDVLLEPASIAEKFEAVENVPEVISQAIGLPAAPTVEPVALQ